jgi:hypothetical protein
VSGHRVSLLRRAVQRGTPPPEPTDFAPTRLMVVDVEEPAASLRAATAPGGTRYRSAEVLVRLHARPLGVLTVDLDGSGALSPAHLHALVEQRWGDTVRRHLAADAGVSAIPADGPWRGCVLRPSTPPPAVSVVVPTCRRPDDVTRCVDSILATGYPRLEVLVVDNAPTDPATARVLADRYAGDARVRYLSEPVPGASRARNLGVARSDGEVVAFTDDDVVVDRYWLAALTHALSARPEVGAVTGLVVPAALDTPVHLWFEQFGGFNRGYRQRAFDLAGQRGDTLLYPYTAGAFGGLGNCAFRRESLRRPRPFDVTLGPGTPAFGAEDQDAFVALLRAGGTLLYEPAALVRHSHRETYADLRWQVFTYGAGQTAAFVHWALHDRRVLLDLARRAPAVVPILLGRRAAPGAAPTRTEQGGPQLRRLERLGYLYGPVAYARAALASRRGVAAG